MTRTEFGYERSTCGCRECQKNCRVMPGFLIPADLERIIPPGADPFEWAESNLLASPGALAVWNGEMFRIHTLVPAVKPDGSCIHLAGGKRNGRCQIHAVAPFGCAFFDCKSRAGDTRDRNLSHSGLAAVHSAGPASLYHRLWEHLDARGKRQSAPEILRAKMKQMK
jgi:hypothetical protein